MKKKLLIAISILTFGALPTKAQINKIYEFDFNNVITATAGVGTFTNTGGTYTYTTDRHGNANSAVALNNSSAFQANLNALPTGNSARTISLWFNAQSTQGTNVFYYGSSSNGSNQKFGVYKDAFNPMNLALGNDNSNMVAYITYTNNALHNTWNHLAVSYNGTKIKAYLNGNLYFGKNVTINTITGQPFVLHLPSAFYDDLKIYDGALTDAQVAGLFAVNDTISTILPTAEPIVNIPDNNFKAAALTYSLGSTILNRNGDNEIQVWETTIPISNFNFSNKNISDLTGIETFLHLQTLDCSNNQLTSINTTSLTNLGYLYCQNNQLTSLNLNSCTYLNDFSCDNNQLTSLDLSSKIYLTKLSCANNQLTNLNIANGYNTNITNLNAQNNPSLTCIQVDNPTYSNTNWTGSSFQKDAGTNYSANCSVTTGILEAINGESNLYVYPNPANDILTIKTNGFTKKHFANIVNVLGETVITFDLSEETNLLNISKLVPGVYFLIAKNNKSIKFIKE